MTTVSLSPSTSSASLLESRKSSHFDNRHKTLNYKWDMIYGCGQGNEIGRGKLLLYSSGGCRAAIEIISIRIDKCTIKNVNSKQ